MKTPQFTFVLPHKNLPEGYLRRCLDSIPHQEDVQIIVVDDESDPKKVDLEHLPGLNEACTEVIFIKQCKGLGHARNIALPYVKGEWVFFTDTDDYYDTEALLKVMEICRQDTVHDILYFGYNIVEMDGGKKPHDLGFPVSDAVQELNDKRPYYEGEHYAWCKVMRTSFVKKHNLQFEEVRRQEDVRYAVQALYHAKNVAVYPMPVYCYQMREGSIIKDPSIETIRISMNVYIRTYRWMREHQLPHMCDASWRFLYSIRRKSYLLGAYYVLKEMLMAGFKTGWNDFRKANAIPGKTRMVLSGRWNSFVNRIKE